MPAAARWGAVVGLVLAGIALVAVAALTTPWSPLPGRVPGGRVAADAAADFTPTEVAREVAFHRAVRPPVYLSLALGLLAAAALGLTPLGSRLVTAVGRPLGGGWLARVVLGALAVAVAGQLVTLPLNAWAEVALRRYGLSTQAWPSWFADQLRGLGITVVLTTVVAAGFYSLARAAPRLWWLPVALAGAGLVFALSFLYPVVVEPVFNHFTPLPAGELRTSLLQLTREDGVPVTDVLVADASRRTTALNAYVSGYGRTRRIVVYDTLLRASPQEVRLVVAHELGHAKRNDVLHGTTLGALGMAAAVCLIFLAMSWPPLLRRAGVESAGDPRSVALAFFLALALTTLTTPAQNLVSRRIEARADVHSLDLTRDPATFIASEQRLARTNLSDLYPAPLVYGLVASHPSTPERIALARSWARQHGVRLAPRTLPPAG
ncbi:MAG: M48 family metallopeptidase [Frankiaceae bacterium]